MVKLTGYAGPRIETQTLPPPPGIIGSLRIGFDAIAAHVTIILMPLALDLLLWLGPRLSMDRLMQPVLRQFGTLATSGGLKPEDIQNTLDMYGKFFQAFNLLGIVRTFPIGISSLMSGVMPTQTPWGTSQVLEVASLPQLLALGLFVTFVGWVIGGLYFGWVAALATPGASPEARTPAGRAVVQTVIYTLIWSIASWVVGLPLALLLYALFMINAVLGEGVLLLLGFLSMWLVVPIFFSPHGIFVRKQKRIRLHPKQLSPDPLHVTHQQPVRVDGFPAGRRSQLSMVEAGRQFLAGPGWHFRPCLHHNGPAGFLFRLLRPYELLAPGGPRASAHGHAGPARMTLPALFELLPSPVGEQRIGGLCGSRSKRS